MSIASLLIFVGILFSLVIIHELGHFLFAKLMKMRVDEFAFGFPPRLWTRQIGETRYSLNLLPIGGYVKIFGEQGLEESEEKKLENQKDLHRSFDQKSILARLLVLAGGVLFNLIACVLLLSVSYMLGSKVALTPQEVASTPKEERQLTIVSVHKESNLYAQGVREGDVLLNIRTQYDFLRNEEVNSSSAIEFIKHNESELLNLEIQKSTGQVVTYSAVPQAGLLEGKKILGIGLADLSNKKLGIGEAIQRAAVDTFEYTKLFLGSFIHLIKGAFTKGENITNSLSGPVGMAVATKDIAEKDLSYIAFFAAMISLSLAVFNILPIPALDGGRILFVLSEIPAKLIWKRKLPKSIEQITHALGFLFLIGLMIFVTYFDILKLFK
jgi:regulator of sigma E protease